MQAPGIHAIYVDAEPLTDFLRHRGAHCPGVFLASGAGCHPEHHFAVLGIGGDRRVFSADKIRKPFGNGGFGQPEHPHRL